MAEGGPVDERKAPTPPPPSRGSRHLWPIAALAALTLVFYWRITRHLSGDAWPNDLEDGAGVAWNLWYFPHALFSGKNPFATTDIFYPVGTPLGFHAYAPLLSLTLWPVTLLFGIPTSYVLATLLGPAVSGVGAYLLTFHLLRDRWAAFFAGAAYVMLPDRVMRMAGHMNLNHTEALPFVLLALLLFYENPSRRRALLLGAALAGSLYIEPIFTAFLLILMLVVAAMKWRSTRTRPHLVGWAWAAGAGLVLASPLLVAMATQVFRGELDPVPGWGGAEGYSADLLSYVIPPYFNPVYEDTFWADAYWEWTSGERFTFVGWTVLALAGVAVARWRHPEKRVLLALAATFAMLSLGPYLHVAGHTVGVNLGAGQFSLPMPYQILHYIPVMETLRVPGRFGFLTDLLLAVVAAAGLRWVLTRAGQDRRPWLRPALTLAAVGLLAVESLPGEVPAFSGSSIPAVYDVIADDDSGRAVLELPIQWRDGFDRTGDRPSNRDHSVFLYYATHHGKPVTGGLVSRFPDAREAALLEIPVIRQIMSLQGDLPPQEATFTADDLRALGIGWVVAHRDRPVPQAEAYVAALGLPVIADDGTVIAWAVPS